MLNLIEGRINIIAYTPANNQTHSFEGVAHGIKQ